MKRPLFSFGFAFFLALLAASVLPGRAVWAIAVLLGTAFLAAFAFALFLRKKGLQLCALLLFAVFAAFGMKSLFDFFLVSPIRGLAGETRQITARVTQAGFGYGYDYYYATLQVFRVEGCSLPAFTVEISTQQELPVGEMIRAEASFYSIGLRYAGQGKYIGATLRGIERLGINHSPATALRSLQYGLSAAIRANMPYRQGAVAAAMAVGDKRFIPTDITRAYRNTGISHLLVISGLQLSLIAGMLNGLVGKFIKSRRAGGLVCMAFVLFFMVLTGLEPSMVRSGVMHLLLYAGWLFRRRADTLNSLGLAAILLCAANPYAVLDMGLLLSFAATLGLCAANPVYARLAPTLATGPAALQRLGGPVAQNLLGTAMASLATLPVLIAFGAGVSLLTLPLNLLLLPLNSLIVVLCLLCALPQLPVLAQLGSLFSWLNSFILGLLDSITQYFSAFRGVYYHVGGLFALVACLAIYGLLLLGWHTRRLRLYLPAGLVVLALALGMHTALNRDVVTVSTFGSGANPSVMVSHGGQAVVLYRSRVNPQMLSDALWRNNAEGCVLLVDLRTNPQSTEYVGTVPIGAIIVAQHDVVSRKYVQATDFVSLYLIRQGEGNLAVADIGGYTVAVPAGHVNLKYYGPFNAVFMGSGRLDGLDCQLLAASGYTLPEVDGAEKTALGPTLFIRPGKSVMIQELN